MKFFKKRSRSYGIYLATLVLLCSQLLGCRQNEPVQSAESTASSIQESSQLQTEESESSEAISSKVEEEKTVTLVVQPGSYVTDILEQLCEKGWGQSAEELLEVAERMDRSEFYYWNQIEASEKRAFLSEGYIAPGTYEWAESESAEEVLKRLLGSWDEQLPKEWEIKAKEQGYTMDQILVMASIVEWESSFDPKNIVKPQVAAVVRNRIESGTALQMDVTVFYLQESLQPYRNPEEYEEYYDTYITDGLPAGPIGSPSLDSIRAVLEPADSRDLFFVYDEDGNYYFAEDYDQHLENCRLAGIE